MKNPRIHYLGFHGRCSPQKCEKAARLANEAETEVRMQAERDRQDYADITDELNDPCSHQSWEEWTPEWCPYCLKLSDLDGVAVDGAERYAIEHGLPWPPGVGDYDRYYESQLRRRHLL